MYTREQASRARQAFWTAFGQYLAPHPGSEGLKVKVNWANYKTGFRGLYFQMYADNKEAFIGIVMKQTDPDLRALFYEQFEELKPVLHSCLNEQWRWEAEASGEHGQPQSRIYTTLSPVSIFRQEEWPQLISFFKPRIIALDEFWSMGKYHFEPLR
ncbi:MAG: DUF4268 domain-containing protein [Phaeodactylibacter sp.]|nr:DUF4268 domain-containing protein [Phaeodactylibacter sp.]